MASAPAPTPPPPPPPSSQPQTQPSTTDKYNNTNPLIHNVALGVTPLALFALFLPPRRLDLRATLLGGVALWGTNQLAHDYSGASFAQRFSARMAALAGTELPEKARATQARLREEKERRERLRTLRDEMVRSGAVKAGTGEGYEGWSEGEKRALMEAYERVRKEEEAARMQGGLGDKEKEGKGKEKEKGLLYHMWMGDAAPDWKEKRDQREKEALQEGGGGYWGLIMDQIAEVWSGDKKDGGDGKKEDTGDDAKKP